MGKVVKVIKTIYGKIDWGILKTTLMKLLNLKIIVKESNTVIKFDKKFVREYVHSTYTVFSNKIVKNVKANIVNYIVEIVENSGHVSIEDNKKQKHNIDAYFGFEKYKCRFVVIDKINKKQTEYSCILVVRCPNFKEKYLYDIINIKKAGNPQ